MPAGDQQCSAGLWQRSVVEQVDGDVAHQVVHPVQRLVQGDGERLRRSDADDERAHQARTGGDRDPVHLGQVDVGGLARAAQGGDQRLQVGAAGDLGHDAAETDVLLDGGGDGVGQQLVAPDDADAGLVTGGLDAKDQWAGVHAHSTAQASPSRSARSITRAWWPGP